MIRAELGQQIGSQSDDKDGSLVQLKLSSP